MTRTRTARTILRLYSFNEYNISDPFHFVFGAYGVGSPLLHPAGRKAVLSPLPKARARP
jgi:hypothetical protein